MSENNSTSKRFNIFLTIAVIAAVALGIYFYITVGMNTHVSKSVTKSRYDNFWLPSSNSTYAPKIDDMFNMIMWITMIVFVLVELGIVYFLIRYRHKPGRKALYTHGNNKLEIAWTIVPAVILVTVPELAFTQVIGAATPPPEASTCPAVPAVMGKLKLKVPAAACGLMLTTPEVFPETDKLPSTVPA